MSGVENPVLRGFNPDPSIVRVGDDYYIATSTFEWYPGVQISHSRDLVNWRVVARPLSRYSQLDLRGNQNSGGIWAPCLTFADGLFHLIYTNSRRWTGPFKDAHNYLVTAPAIEGPWSEPIYMNSSGFDPSLFHDDDGRKWFVNMLWDHRPGNKMFGGILLQEYDPKQQRLVGPVTNIFRGTELGLVEGPHLYKRDGYYYLLTAEGGTFITHAATVARSRTIEGPYETMPNNPLISSAAHPELKLQSSGHGSFVEHKDGTWGFAHLCRRPLANGRSTLGRETALQAIHWVDGWPRLASGDQVPLDVYEGPNLPLQPWPSAPARSDFDEPTLGIEWQAPRVSPSDVSSLTARPGFLRLIGRESITSHFEQALIARRQQAKHVQATTCLQFEPQHFQQMAGLVAFYSTDSFYYLYVSRADHAKKCLSLIKCERGNVSFPVEKEYTLDGLQSVYLRLEIKGDRLSFFSREGGTYHAVGWEQDASILSDEHAVPCGFTGNFVGMACQDLAGTRLHADFDWFEYRELG